MVVSGDRDVYQVVGDGVRVMTTSRGVTETKVYDREGVIERYGVPPELVPDLIGLKGDTSDNIPGRPGDRRQDRRPAPAGVRLAGGGAGQRRQDLGREAQAEPDRARRRRPGLEAAGDAGVRRSRCRSTSARRPARSPTAAALREVAARVRAARGDPAARRGVPGGRARPRRSRRRWSSRPRRGRRPISPTDRSRSPSRPGSGRPATASGWSPATPRTWSQLAEQLRGRPLIAHDAKSQGGGGRAGLLAVAPPGSLDLEHDTMVAAYLIDPARRVYDLNELAADAGLAAAPAGADAGPAVAGRRGGRGGRRSGRRGPPGGRAGRPPARAASPSSGSSGC